MLILLILPNIEVMLLAESLIAHMERILERYERYSSAERQLIATDHESHGSWSLQHAKLKSRIEALQKTQRHIMGEDLDSLSLKELQNLEQQLDTALKHVRLRKNQMMFESISRLQKKDKELQIQNSVLTKKVNLVPFVSYTLPVPCKLFGITEVEKELSQQPPGEQRNPENISSFHFGTYISNEWQAGGNGAVEEESPREAGQPSIVLPPWMLQHMNQ
ncbi:hypothetical protein OSB04_005272 [Centaurea solstitialis]|uniref:K-box domain-containing protein n=1 Tax=Centaurea solstitialis TaxID=347529 RepID=A0AA38TYS9_9ASTR|nr:hypothetical protein OSB04_005272 [Centaurea solstitialis]